MNKTLKIYGILFVVVLIILAIFVGNKKEVTDWRKNFKVDKKTPFGLFVFNKEVDYLLGNEVSRSEESPYDFYNKNPDDLRNILITATALDSESWRKILDRVNHGASALIIAKNSHPNIEDSLGISVVLDYDNEKQVLRLTIHNYLKDSLVLDKYPSGHYFDEIKPEYQILGTSGSNSRHVNFIKIKLGKGTLLLHTEPLALTNYYLLKPENQKYVEDVFSYFPNGKTVWFQLQNRSEVINPSPLRFILANPALRYAWYLLLGSLLIFVIFGAKRKQRVVPIIDPPENKTVEFVRSIGNLYLQEGDFHDMMAKKAQYFLHRVRIELLLDTRNLDDDFVQALHLKTGKELVKIAEAVALIKKGIDPTAFVMREDLIKMNTLLDQILK